MSILKVITVNKFDSKHYFQIQFTQYEMVRRKSKLEVQINFIFTYFTLLHLSVFIKQ